MGESKDKKVILLAEDDSFVSDIYARKFKQEGYEVIIAENGLEAIKKMKKNVPSIVLLDVVMPYMDGNAVLKKIRERDEFKEVSVIMLTNLSEKENIGEEIDVGVDDYIIKSQFTPSEVLQKSNALFPLRLLLF